MYFLILIGLYNRFSFGHLSFCVKKYLPQSSEISSVLSKLKASGIANHEFLKYDFYGGKHKVNFGICFLCQGSLAKNSKIELVRVWLFSNAISLCKYNSDIKNSFTEFFI